MAEEAWLMHANFLQIEGATNLHLLPPTGCLLSIGFAKILGGAGGYARLIAVCPEDWAHGVTVATHPGAPLPSVVEDTDGLAAAGLVGAEELGV